MYVGVSRKSSNDLLGKMGEEGGFPCGFILFCFNTFCFMQAGIFLLEIYFLSSK